jgi:hypothetical protein
MRRRSVGKAVAIATVFASMEEKPATLQLWVPNFVQLALTDAIGKNFMY